MPRILVVDDAEVDRRVLGGVLQQDRTMEVGYAYHAGQALEKLDEGGWDVVIADLIMPGMGGLQLVDEVRQRHPMVPVVIVTSGGSEFTAVEALKRGAASYVPKQMLAMLLLKTVHELLALSTVSRTQERLMECLVRSEEAFTLENDLPLVDSLVVHVIEQLKQMRLFEASERRSVGVALKESLTNALYHGNLALDPQLRSRGGFQYDRMAQQRRNQDPYRTRRIHVLVSYSPEEVQFTVRDEGQGFDIQAIPDPEAPIHADNPLGRGITLMRSFMDEVMYNDSGNEVIMVKRVPPL